MVMCFMNNGVAQLTKVRMQRIRVESPMDARFC